MTRDRHLAFTAIFAPIRRFRDRPPPWPEIVGRMFPDPELPSVDPVEAVLHGPIPRRRLGIATGPEGMKAQLMGFGDAFGVSVIAGLESEEERAAPTKVLRARCARALLEGMDVAHGETETGEAPLPDEDVLASGLAERLGGNPEWELLGFCEVETLLLEGIPGDLPPGGSWAESGSVRIGRARGVGEGHVAWEVRGHHISRSERDVVDRRLTTLREGYLAKVSAPAEYAAAALRWGRSARRALGQADALDALVDQVRAAASMAVASGVDSGEAPPDLLGLTARLEMLRVGLVEEVETLRVLRGRLAGSASRVFGTAAPIVAGPFPEGVDDGAKVLEALEAREASAGRWAAVLATAMRAREARG